MTLADAVGVYAPFFFGFGAVPVVLIIGASLVQGSRVSPRTVLILVGVMAFGAVLAIGLASSVVLDALRKGVYVTGEVLSVSRGTVTFRVPIRGQQVTSTYSPRNTNWFAVGDRFDLLVDPNTQKTLMYVGPPTP